MASPPLDEAPTEDASLYAVLNVRRDASEDEIKRAYRQLASTLHPMPPPPASSTASKKLTRSSPTRRGAISMMYTDQTV